MNCRRDPELNIHTLFTRTSIGEDRRVQVLSMIQRRKALVRVFAWSQGMDPLDVCLFVEDENAIWCRTFGAPQMFQNDKDALLMAAVRVEDWINQVDGENNLSQKTGETSSSVRPSVYMPSFPLDITAYSRTCMLPFRPSFEKHDM
jgi:hypothetical protein